MDFHHSSRARSFKDKVRAFIQNEILPVEHRHFAEMAARHLGPYLPGDRPAVGGHGALNP